MDTSILANRFGWRIDATFHPAPNEAWQALIERGFTGSKERPSLAGPAAFARSILDGTYQAVS